MRTLSRVRDLDSDPVTLGASDASRRNGPRCRRPYASAVVLEPVSEDLRVGATNLVERARTVLDDPSRARCLIEHAVDLPFDERERIYPGVLAAHHNLYESLSEAIALLDEDDGRWVTAALRVYRSTNETGRDELADVLMVLFGEGAGNPRLSREVRAVIGDLQPRHAVYDDPPIGRANQIAYVESLLRTEIEFDDAFNDLLAG